MAGEVTVTECPNCGGPIDPHAFDGVDDPRCPHCHAALTVAKAPAPFMPQSSIEVSGVAHKANRVGSAITAIVLLGTAAFVFFIVHVTTSATKHIKDSVSAALGSPGSLRPDGPVIPVSAAPGQTDIYVVARSSGSSTEVLRRVDPVRRKVLWSGPNLNQLGDGAPTVVPGPTQVFAVYNSTVLALDAVSGRQVWQASLSNGLASPCASGCAVLVGQDFITLAKDGVVQALNVANGSQAWSRRLNSTPRLLEAAGTFVAVTDTTGPTGSDQVVLVANAATGAVHQITPVCAADPSDPSRGTRPHEDDEFFVSPDRTTLTVLVTGTGGCAAHYRLADGALLWQTPRADDNSPIPFTLTGNSTALSATSLFFTNDDHGAKAVFALDVATGAIRQVWSVTKTEVEMVGAIGPTLVVEAAPTYDSNKPAVVAIDVASGRPRWQIATRVRASGDTQAVKLTDTAPIIVSCNSSADTCTFEAVDLQTGTITGTSTLPALPGGVDEVLTRVTPSSLVAAVGWQHAAGFDPTTAAVQWKWPG